MTSPSLRNRRTTTPPAWIRISLAGLALSVVSTGLRADDLTLPGQDPVRSLPPVDERRVDADTSPLPPALPLPAVDAAPSEFRQQHETLMRETIASHGRAAEVRGNLVATQATDDEDDDRIDTKPPSRERLFRILNTRDYLISLEDKYRGGRTGRTTPFFLPAPIDQFNGPDNPVLSRLWYQNRISGQNADPIDRQKGNIGVGGGMAVVPVGSEPEVAIINEAVGSPDMQVLLVVELGGEENTFGVVLRALDPDQWDRPVDQIEANSYYYVLFGSSSVALYTHEPGQDDQLIKSADIPAKQSFEIDVTVSGDMFVVKRDGETVLDATHGPKTDINEDREFAGMISGITEGTSTRVDDFAASRFGGYYQARSFAPTMALYRGPNVHYHPLYFEQLALERYGHHLGNLVAPIMAHGLFFAHAATLPYSLGKSHPWDCHNDVCYYKPGDLVPFRIYFPTADPKATMLQATAMALSWTVIP